VSEIEVYGQQAGQPGTSPFDQFRRVRPDGTEYWSARDVQVPFGFSRWENFKNPMRKATNDFIAIAGGNADDHFHQVVKMVPTGPGAMRPIEDYHLSRVACYLTALNCNTEEGSHARGYFAARTRQAELLTARPAVSQPDAPPVVRAWSERFRETCQPHFRYMQEHHPYDFWTVVTATIGPFLMIEDELLRHLFELSPGDRPDVSVGRRWAEVRRGRGWAEVTVHAPLCLPGRDDPVPVNVYDIVELPEYNRWFNDTYLRSGLLEYLNRKPEFRPAGSLSRASVADNACLGLTGRHAELPSPLRRQLTRADGFAPIGHKPPPALSSPGLFDG
jgi:hypothetical protein